MPCTLLSLLPRCVAALTVMTIAAPAAASAQDLAPFLSPIIGGAGVNPRTLNLACPSGEMATGLTGRYGLYIDKLTLWCAPLNANGTLGTSHSVTSQGGSGGTADLKLRCPSGHVIKGISPYIGSALAPYVIRLGVYCRKWEIDRWGSTGNLVGPQGGTGGATYNRLDCPSNKQPVIAFRGRYGSYIDAIGITCDEVARPNATNPLAQ